MLYGYVSLIHAHPTYASCFDWECTTSASQQTDCSCVNSQSWARTFACVLSLHNPVLSDSMLTCKLSKCQTECQQGKRPLHLVSWSGDKDKGNAIVALVHSHGPDLSAQDDEVRFCTCAVFHGKWRKHMATQQCLSYSNPVCILNAFCNIVQCQDHIEQALLNVMWPWLHDCNIPTHQQGISKHV